MIVMRIKHTHQAAAGEADGGGGLNLQPDADAGEDGGGGTDDAGDGEGPDDGPVDRGDELTPPLNPDALAKVAEGAGNDDADHDDDGTAPAPDGAGKKAPQSVPIARLNEVIEQRNQLKAENDALKAGKETPGATPQPTAAPAPAFDITKAEREYAEFLADGEFDKAVELRAKINAQLVEQAEINVEARQAQRSAQSSLTEVANQAVADWPYLEDDAETMELIIAARDAGVRKGVSPAQALKAAVDRIAPKFAPEGGSADDGTPGKELPSGKPRVDTRPQGANARGAAASAQQPPLAAGSGNRQAAGKVDVESMTEAQFDALTPAEKKRLRGDA